MMSDFSRLVIAKQPPLLWIAPSRRHGTPLFGARGLLNYNLEARPANVSANHYPIAATGLVSMRIPFDLPPVKQQLVYLLRQHPVPFDLRFVSVIPREFFDFPRYIRRTLPTTWHSAIA
jgi:hypothetical protein